MPDRDWPPMQRRLARIIRTAAYTAAALAGAEVLIGQPTDNGVSIGWAVVMSALAFTSGSVAAVAAAAHRWQVEWVAVAFVTAAFYGYAVMEWTVGHTATAAALAYGGGLSAARFVDLWVFSVTAVRVRRARVRTWRRVAGLEP